MKRYLVEFHVFDGYGEDDAFEIEADTLEEAEDLVAEHETEPDEDGCFVNAEIVDRRVLGAVLPESRYAEPGIVYDREPADARTT